MLSASVHAGAKVVSSAHRFLIGYVYGRDESPSGGVVQIWLVRRLATVVALQPIVFGLLLLTRELWVEGGVSAGTGVLTIIVIEELSIMAHLPQHVLDTHNDGLLQ